MKLTQIAEVLGSKHPISVDTEIQWLLTDSRSLSFPAESLFFALVSDRNNGHKYIAELYRQELRYFVVSEYLPEFEKFTDAVFIQVPDTLKALQHLAAIHRAGFQLPVIAITGSNGKTIIKEWLYQLMHPDFNIVRSPRSYNSQIGVPLSVWSIDRQNTLGIFEAGISKPGEMKSLERIIQPQTGIFANLGDAHQENFIHLRQKCEEKIRLFEHAEHIIYNSDQILTDEILKSRFEKGRLLSWGRKPGQSVRLVQALNKGNSTILDIEHKGLDFQVELPFTDDASIENIMHCITLMLFKQYQPDVIAARVKKLEPVEMRLEVKEGNHNSLIINDSYNSDLNSLGIALDFLDQQATDKNLTKTVILSDILQIGQRKSELYATVAGLLKARGVNRLIGIGDNISHHSNEFRGIQTKFYLQTDEFIKSAEWSDFENQIVLLKGSRNFHFENISDRLEKKLHETTLDVNLNALIENLNYFRAKLHPETKVMCMVKAFAYGSGSVEVAKTLQHHRCDYLAVAVADEGVELRNEGIRIPIVVMNPEQSGFSAIFEYNLEPEIYSFDLLENFIRHASKLGITHYPIHIKIDTGMHRLGFDPDSIPALIDKISSQNQVKIRSVFSHLAGADEPKLDAFTHQQYKIFLSCADKITAAFPHYIMKHLLNSAGTQRFSEYQLDMVRLGIGHYGISAIPEVKLRQVCTLKTVILQIKTVKSGETVGYSRNGKILKDSRIAILPIGYADGFNRKLGNGVGEVFIHGQRAKVVGNVSMDLTAVDLGEIEANEGDSVEIFGEHILIAEMAEKLGTIPYEILTNISRRVKRIYFQE